MRRSNTCNSTVQDYNSAKHQCTKAITLIYFFIYELLSGVELDCLLTAHYPADIESSSTNDTNPQPFWAAEK
jgi:hypothetical protein